MKNRFLRTYAYDAEGRRIGSTLNTTTYRYNAQGQRTEKSQGTGQRRFAYDLDGRLLGEYTSTGQALREYVYLNDTPVALLDYPNGTTTPIVYNILSDRLNTPREITDANHTPVWRWEGEAFGANAPDEDPDGNGIPFTFNLSFPGQYYDQESGLNYNYFRDYDPANGRYIQSDPIGLEGGIKVTRREKILEQPVSWNRLQVLTNEK